MFGMKLFNCVLEQGGYAATDYILAPVASLPCVESVTAHIGNSLPGVPKKCTCLFQNNKKTISLKSLVLPLFNC